MVTNRLGSGSTSGSPGEIVHPLTSADGKAMDAIRVVARRTKDRMERVRFDRLMGETKGATTVTYEPGFAGGISGIWCWPSVPSADAVILYLHGGAYIAGTAHAFRHFGGQVAARSGAVTFVADYRLAPEHRFPAAISDATAAYRGLLENNPRAIAVVGDSAGAGLALAVLGIAQAEANANGTLAPCAGVALSPWVDLALTGESMLTRAAADPFLTKAVLAAAADKYLARQDPRVPLASPLYGDLAGLPPLQIHVGMDEILLDDARSYADRARAAGVDVALHVWEGMPHVFEANVGKLGAADLAMEHVGAFVRQRLAAPPR